MGRLLQFRDQLLRDRRITEDEVDLIRDFLQEDGKLDLDDVKLLVELTSEAIEVTPSFDDLFFPILKDVILADGRVGLDEQFFLLKMLYSNGRVRDREKQLLLELRRDAREVTPEFEALCEEALGATATGWSVGGR